MTVHSFVGQHWLLIEVDRDTHRTQIPSDVRASVDFSEDGRMVAFDGTNTLSGKCSSNRGGFTATDMKSTLALYVGSDPARKAAINGLAAAFFGSGSSAQTSPSPAVQVKLDGSRLQLSVQGYRLVFAVTGPARTFPLASAP